MLFGRVIAAAEQRFSRTSTCSVYQICYTASHFSLSKMVALLCKQIAKCERMEWSHHVNWNSIIYRKGAIHRTEKERPIIAAKGFNNNLVHSLPPYHVIISSLPVYYFTGTISNVHGRAPKTALLARNLVYKKKKNYEGLTLTMISLYIFNYRKATGAILIYENT